MPRKERRAKQQAALGQKNSRPPGKPPRGYENWDADAGVWRNDEGETPLEQERHKEKIRMQHARIAADRAAKLIVDLHGVERPRDASHAAEYIGLTVKVPQSAFDDDPESELLAGLVWAYVRQRDGEASTFQIRFDPALKRADVRVSWDQLLGAEPCGRHEVRAHDHALRARLTHSPACVRISRGSSWRSPSPIPRAVSSHAQWGRHRAARCGR